MNSLTRKFSILSVKYNNKEEQNISFFIKQNHVPICNGFSSLSFFLFHIFLVVFQ